MKMNADRLPAAFLQEMKKLLGDEYSDYLKHFEQTPLKSLRVNDRKIPARDFGLLMREKAGITLDPVPWIPNGFYYPDDFEASKHPFYYGGLYYIQEASAMTPAHLLPVEPGDMVLDLCAAPGGKSTELGVKLNGTGLLFANDLSSSRAKALVKNLERFGLSNICVTGEAPKRLADAWPEFFHKILVDAPCSGEGMFRKDGDMVKAWQQKGPDFYAPIQKELLKTAYKMLQPGGYLLYSTCTFAAAENEEVIDDFLGTHQDMALTSLPDIEGAARGIGMPEAIRLFPHRIKGEGHFTALLQKAGSPGDCPGRVAGGAGSKTELPEAFTAFAQLLKQKYNPDQLQLIGQNLYYLPKGFIPGKKLRYLRTGLLLGECKKKRFEPSQALAMTLGRGDFAREVEMPVTDPRIERYLKGETLLMDEQEPIISGLALLSADGFPLGWVKGQGQTLKNKYYPGWRKSC